MSIDVVKLLDSNNQDFGVSQTDSKLNVIAETSLQGKSWKQQISEGLLPEYSFVEKFGENPDIDTTTAPEDIWSYGGLYTFSTSADIDTVSSSSTSDVADVTIQGLDSNWELLTQTITLTGQAKATLPIALVRVFRMWNANTVDLVGTVYCYVDSVISSGVPTVASTVRAIISLGSGQTEMCIYTIPAGKTGYFSSGYVSMSRSKKESVAVFTSRMRLFNDVFRVASRIACLGNGNSSWNYQYPFSLALPAKTDLILRCDEVAENDTGVSGGFTILLKDD